MSKKTSEASAAETGYTKIELKNLREPQQVVRVQFDKDRMNELIESIMKVGVIEPLIVKRVKKGYEIVAGHRRYKASKAAGLKEVPCIIVEDKKNSAEIIKLHENFAREEINMFDEALFIKTMMKKLKMKQKEYGRFIGKSEAYVSDRLAILTWPEFLQRAVQEKKVVYSVARELTRIDDKDVLKAYLGHAAEGGASITVVKQWVEDWLRSVKGDAAVDKRKRADVGGVGGYQVKAPCVVCAGDFKIEDTLTFRLCRECAKTAGLIS